MQKTYNILSVIAILGLGAWVFFLMRANSKWKALISQRISTLSEQIQSEENTARKAVTLDTLWEGLQKSVGEITMDMKFKDQ